MSSADITVYFNPRCSKCRQTMALLEEKNVKPEVIEYLQSPPSKEELTHIIGLGIPARDLIRTNEDEWEALGLDIESASDGDLINAIISAPKILQRPIVISNGKATLGRPPEKVLDIL